MKSSFKIPILATLLTLVLGGCASNTLVFDDLSDGLCSKDQVRVIEKHISGQINALSDENWKKAYSFASPSFQEVVPIQRFEEIIQNEYEMIINNDGFKFTSCSIEGAKFSQMVVIKSGSSEIKLVYRLTLENGKLGVEAATAAPAEPEIST